MTKKISIFKFTVILITVFGLFFTSCKKDDDEVEPAAKVATSMELVSGNAQTATVETALANPIVVMVTDQDGNAFEGATVNFAVTEGSVPATAITDAEGKASATWTLGATVDTQTLNASATGLTGSPVVFSATGEAVPVVGNFAEGGVVFHIFIEGENGYVAGETHGLVCAVEDQAVNGAAWSGNTSISVAGATSNTDGAANTKAIVEDNNTADKAATLCTAYRGGNFDDWFLPSNDRLADMYTNREAINTTAANHNGTDLKEGGNSYWSSTEYDGTTAWAYYFGGDNSFTYDKDFTYRVRAVRAF